MLIWTSRFISNLKTSHSHDYCKWHLYLYKIDSLINNNTERMLNLKYACSSWWKKKQFDESNLTWGPLSNQNYVVHHCSHNGQFYPKASSDSVGKKAISWEQMKKDFLKNMGQFLKFFSSKHMWGFIWDGENIWM